MNNAPKFEKSKFTLPKTSMQTAPITGAGITATFNLPARKTTVPQANAPEADAPAANTWPLRPAGDDNGIASDLSEHADENAASPGADDGATNAGFPASAVVPANEPAASPRASFDAALDPVILGQAPEIKAPLNRVPPAVEEFARGVADSAGVSASFVLVSVLSSTAVAIGMSRIGRAGPEWVVPSTLWFANNGEASSGKSPAMGRAMKPFDTVVAEIVGPTRARTKPAPDAGLRERVIERARDMEMPLPVAETVVVEAARPFMCHAVTLPGIEKVAVGNPRQVMIRRDEGIPLLKTKDPELRAALLSAYDGAPYRRTTGKGDVDLPHFGLWIIVGVQPDKLTPLLDSLTDDGLGARFLPVVGSAMPLEQMGARVDDGPMEDILRWLFALQMDEGPLGPVPREIPFSLEAQALIFRRRQTARAQAALEVGLMAGVMGKSAGTVARLALILGLVRAAAQTQEEPAAIEARDVHDAAALFDEFFAPMARAAYGLQSCTPVEQAARKLVQALKAAGRKTISVRDLQRMATAGFNKGDDFLELLVWLEAKNVLMWLGAEPSGPQGGAPSPRYAVHPQIWQWDWAPKV